MSNGRDFSRFAPVTRAEAQSAGVQFGSRSVSAEPPAPVSVGEDATLTPSASLAVPQTASAPAKALPRFVGGPARSAEVPLRYPIEFDGVTWTGVPLRRPSAAEVREFFERLSQIGTEEWLQFPIYAREDGTPVPSEVIRFLDPDDADAVQEAAADFLCARLLQLQEIGRASSIPPAPASTGPTSSN